MIRPCILIFSLFTASVLHSQSQSEQDKFIGRIRPTDNAPEGLVSTRSAFLFSSDYTPADLEKIQKAFQQTGIDAVTYVNTDIVVAGVDTKIAYAVRFNKRNIKFLIFARKANQEFQFWFLPFNPKNCWSNPSPAAWMVHSTRLQDLLVSVFRALAGSQKKQNFLINDFPEMEPVTATFANTRNESMISNLKAFKVALPGMGDPKSDQELSDFFSSNFHGRFELTPDSTNDRELVQKGFRYVLRYVHAPGAMAKQIMGYEVNSSESAIASVTFPNGVLQLKTIPSESVIFKFYLKDLEDRNLYLGTKWDGDITWQDALKNHFDSYRASGRIN